MSRRRNKNFRNLTAGAKNVRRDLQIAADEDAMICAYGRRRCADQATRKNLTRNSREIM